VNGNDSALPIEIKNMAWIKPSLALTAAGYRSFDALGFAPRLNDHAIIKADCDLSLSNKDRSTDEIAYFVEFLVKQEKSRYRRCVIKMMTGAWL
jgi:hypothetical protein